MNRQLQIRNIIIIALLGLIAYTLNLNFKLDKINLGLYHIHEQDSIRNIKLNEKLYHLTHGVNASIGKSKVLIEQKKINEAKILLEVTIDKYKESPKINEIIELLNIVNNKIEKELFIKIFPKKDIVKLEEFIDMYPEGIYTNIAIERLEVLYYNKALESRSTKECNAFLSKFPYSKDHKAISSLKKHLEYIEFISRIENKLPVFEGSKGGYSDLTSIEITNNTSSDFKIFFKGVENKETTISIGESVITEITSGNYDIILINSKNVEDWYFVNQDLDGEYYVTYNSSIIKDYLSEKTKVTHNVKSINRTYKKGYNTSLKKQSIQLGRQINNPYLQKVRVGAICNDGTRSYATGRGACSHHGGVDYWIYE